MDDTPRITSLRQKLEKDPGSRVFAQLAEELRKDGRLDEAIEVGRGGLERHPNYPSAKLTVARALLDSGRAGEARPDLEQVVRAAPDNILASRLLGEALEELGEPAEALQQFEHTLQLAPGDKVLVEKIAELKSKPSQASSPPESAAEPVSTVAADVKTPATLASAVPEAALPSAVPEALASVATEAAPPSPQPDQALPAAGHEAGVPPVPATKIPERPPAPAGGVALDRDLASGTFSPGTLKAPDLQEHFDRAASEDTASLAGSPPPPSDAGASLPMVDVPATTATHEPPSVDVPPDGSDVGAATLPLTSLTLADLYLQQGLKAEATAVLAQVMKEEPENAEARSKLAAVSGDVDQSSPEPAGSTAPVGGIPEAVESPALAATAPSAPPPGRGPARAGQIAPPPLSRAEIRDNSTASLNAFLSAVEREALQQRATERGAF